MPDHAGAMLTGGEKLDPGSTVSERGTGWLEDHSDVQPVRLDFISIGVGRHWRTESSGVEENETPQDLP